MQNKKSSTDKKPETILRKRHQVFFHNPSRTKQSHKSECDINNILKKYEKDGIITHGNSKKAIYGDFTNEMEYQEAMNSVIHAQDQFDNLPSKIRDRFSNDPSNLLKFLEDPKNLEEAQQIGLIIKPEALPEPKTPTPPIEDIKK